MNIVPMTTADAEDVLAIYQAGLDTGVASFEAVAPDWTRFDASYLPAHRFVAVDGPSVLGWVALRRASRRDAYSGVVDESVYVRPDVRRKGIGAALLAEVTASTETNGIWTLQTSVFPENEPGIALHRRAGFRTVGVRERVGKRHGIWRDIVLMERRSPNI